MLKKYWKKYGTITAAAAFLTVAGLGYGFLEAGPKDEAVISVISDSEETGETAENSVTGISAKEEAESSGQEKIPEKCFVHICGEVNDPGVYELTAGSRIYEAVEAAGGFTGEAAEDSLNLAQKISDGQQIIILSREEAARRSESQKKEPLSGQQAGTDKTPGPVNINTASRELLMTLNGIGESRADDIIRYREESGGFKRIEDIMKVPGIKDAAFQKIKDSITV